MIIMAPRCAEPACWPGSCPADDACLLRATAVMPPCFMASWRSQWSFS